MWTKTVKKQLLRSTLEGSYSKKIKKLAEKNQAMESFFAKVAYEVLDLYQKMVSSRFFL